MITWHTIQPILSILLQLDYKEKPVGNKSNKFNEMNSPCGFKEKKPGLQLGGTDAQFFLNFIDRREISE